MLAGFVPDAQRFQTLGGAMIEFLCGAEHQPNWDAWAAIGTMLAVAVALFQPGITGWVKSRQAQKQQQAILYPLLIQLAGLTTSLAWHMRAAIDRKSTLHVAQNEAVLAFDISHAEDILKYSPDLQIFPKELADDLAFIVGWARQLHWLFKRNFDRTQRVLSPNYFTEENFQLAKKLCISCMRARDRLHYAIEGEHWHSEPSEVKTLKEIGINIS